MRWFHWVSGELTEVRRFINVPMRWCEQYPARERRELWIKDHEGPDIKLAVHTSFLPARRGHDVDALLFGDLPVGLFNCSTGDQINFLRTDPPQVAAGEVSRELKMSPNGGSAISQKDGPSRFAYRCFIAVADFKARGHGGAGGGRRRLSHAHPQRQIWLLTFITCSINYRPSDTWR